MAGTNKIEVYEGNTLSITCTIEGLANLDGYTGYFTVVDKDEVLLFEKTGSNDGLVITFFVPAADNEIAAGNYEYEVTINDSTNYFTVTQDTYQIKKSVKYEP